MHVSMQILGRICKTLECNIGDVIVILPEEDQ